MKETGSFIELELPVGREWYKGDTDIARLNTGRAAIWHAFRLTGAQTIWIPFYQCESVREFLLRKGCTVKYYHQDRFFTPLGLDPSDDEAVLLVNYFGVMSSARMAELARPYKRVVIDNCQAFFCPPLAWAYNVYSARKLIGVADGSYVIGPDAQRFSDEYPQGYSSDTASFLLSRIEYGCEGKAYEARSLNERRLDTEDVMKMSALTRAMLDGADYERNRHKRQDNFEFACHLFDELNQLQPGRYRDADTVPMVYPLVVEDAGLLGRLLAAKHFQGHWWAYLAKELPKESFEHWLSSYMIPITIDQRYSPEDILHIHAVVTKKKDNDGI